MSTASASDALLPRPGRFFDPIKVVPSIPADGKLQLSDVVLGGGVFGYDYNSSDTLESDCPEQTLRLAFRYGINAIDTSPYYTTSETVIGKALEAIRDEFPRSSYQILTKAGRYGRTREDGFDYSAARVRRSVGRSCELLKTTYLDAVYMHDVEFVAELVGDAEKGGYTLGEDGELRQEDLARWGLLPGDEGKVRGPGDEKVLEALGTLFELKKEGVIRAVGFSGFPLPTLLRLARLSAANLQPLDILQSYCHYTLQNTTLSAFVPHFYAAGVKQVVSASPLSMGLLRSGPSPAWHPASPDLHKATQAAITALDARGAKLEDVALGYGLSSAARGVEGGLDTPTCVGFSNPSEVHATMEVYNKIYRSKGESRHGRLPGVGLSSANSEQLELEKLVVDLFNESKTKDWTWVQGV